MAAPAVLVIERLVGALRRLAPRDQLSLTAVSTLRRLDADGPHRVCELTAPEGVSQPAMTQLITRLEKDGLATRGADPRDGRAVVVSITEAGRAVVHRRRQRWGAAMSALLGQLSPDDQRAIEAALPALERLIELVGEHGDA